MLATLRARGETITRRPPNTWREWVTALTTLFAPANRIALLARDVMTLQAKSDESVDVYALRVSRAYSRLLAEAERTAPANKSPHEHVFDKAMIASFENGIHPHIRTEMLREDANETFMESKGRARKHESNRLRQSPIPATDAVPAVSSMYDPDDTQLAAENQALMARVDKLEEALQHKTYASSVATKPRSSTAKEHAKPRPSVKFADQRKPGSKQSRYSSNNKARGGGSSDPVKKRKANVSNPCDFFLCRGRSGRFTHSRSECDYIRQMEEGGVQLVKKP